MSTILPDDIITEIISFNIINKEIINILNLSKNINNLLFNKIYTYIKIKQFFNKIKNTTIFPKKIITKTNKIKIINVMKSKYRNRVDEPILFFTN